jgi:hypothetical protein
MLRSEVTRSIEEFVYVKPRSIQEIAQHIKKNWRTADRYVSEIEEQLGTLATRVFRSGTRGALKIVYWAAAGEVRNSVFQEQLEKAILSARRKEDFSSFDIYQHIDAKKKTVLARSNEADNLCEFRELLAAAKQQLLLFSGNLSFINLQRKERDVFDVFETLVKKGVSIKILCRVDVAGKNNVERLLSLNFKHGKECIEIHHAEQPLRGAVIDSAIIRLKEVNEPTGKINELNKRLFLYYTIKDKEWASWLSRIFWKLFSASLDSQKRLQEIKRIA